MLARPLAILSSSASLVKSEAAEVVVFFFLSVNLEMRLNNHQQWLVVIRAVRDDFIKCAVEKTSLAALLHDEKVMAQKKKKLNKRSCMSTPPS